MLSVNWNDNPLCPDHIPLMIHLSPHTVNAFTRNYKIIGISFLLKTAAAAANVEMIATTAYLHLQHLQSLSSKSSLLRKSNYKSPKLLYVKYCLLRGIIRFSEDCRLRGKK